MVTFNQHANKVLPYDRREYIEYLDPDGDKSIQWYGASFQLYNQLNDVTEFVENYKALFNNVVLKFGANSFWVVHHDDKDLQWFPNERHNLILLRKLFRDNNMPGIFKGALVFATDDLLNYAQDLISYPYNAASVEKLLYKNIDISNGEQPFIIKITGHMNIDFLSKNKELLKSIVNENMSDVFNIKMYTGTIL